MSAPVKILNVDDDLRRSPRAALFEGERHGGGVAVSSFITQYEQGRGPDQHVHPYAEVFVVERGVAEFRVAGERIEVPAGNVVVVPPETPHGFKNPGAEPLRVISMHPSPRVIQTDLE
ncbi:MAG TPA: cupin domain-containing protein [Capillimicrobium sp.]|nr:cupin domain-containing protein [Capillimicrobium sp.]